MKYKCIHRMPEDKKMSGAIPIRIDDLKQKSDVLFSESGTDTGAECAEPAGHNSEQEGEAI